MIIAIDGPVGSGKTTTAKRVAEKLNFIYLDTGALYRTIALYIHNKNIDIENKDDICSVISNMNFNVSHKNGKMFITLDGKEIKDEIRTPEITSLSSPVSAIPCVREYLIDIQRNFGKGTNLVCEGRDIGTVIFPKAEIKIYLDASITERAKRRYKEYKEKGKEISFNEVIDMIMERDIRDTCRSIAPLRKAKDAILLDTTGMSLDSQIEAVLQVIKEMMSV